MALQDSILLTASTLLQGNTMKEADFLPLRPLSNLSVLPDANDSKEVVLYFLESRSRMTKRRKLGKGVFQSVCEVLGTFPINPCIKPTRINTARALRRRYGMEYLPGFR